MKVFMDNDLLQKINAEEESLLAAKIIVEDPSLQIMFSWPSLLEAIGLGSLFETFPLFDDQNKLFIFLLATLAEESEKDLFIRLYDQTFVECLTQIKALSSINSTFLLGQIHKKREASFFSPTKEFFSPLLEHYEKLLIEDPYNTLHDLTLYLAWDRVCVNLAVVFDHLSSPKTQKGLDVLKECLLESFQHITKQGRTVPSFFRLLETLYAYQMREENFQSYTESEWLLLCQASCLLKPRESLADVFYIDAAVVDNQEDKIIAAEKKQLKVVTIDSPDKVQFSLAFAHFMIEKLKREVPGWHYALSPLEVVYIKELLF